MSKKKNHIPKLGRGAGLSGEALCGRWADYLTGDWAEIWRTAWSFMRRGDTAHYCKRCIARIGEYDGWIHP